MAFVTQLNSHDDPQMLQFVAVLVHDKSLYWLFCGWPSSDVILCHDWMAWVLLHLEAAPRGPLLVMEWPPIWVLHLPEKCSLALCFITFLGHIGIIYYRHNYNILAKILPVRPQWAVEPLWKNVIINLCAAVSVFFLSLSRGHHKVEEACDMYCRSANMFKMAKNWSGAIGCFLPHLISNLQIFNTFDICCFSFFLFWHYKCKV